MEITFRKATKQDIPLITQLAKSIWEKHYISIISLQQINYMLEKMYSSEKLLQEMTEGHIFTLAFVKDKPIGYISFSTKNKKKYFLHKFYIEINSHRKGIGSELFEFALKQLTMPKTIELTVNRKNYKAINFYFKNGFVIKEVADFDIGNGYFMNDFVMVKTILSAL
ncbi:MAG: GNAT family N-acetyltransferase [Bacteroidetes bacterium]|nr:GNAT family N-acetyltransferase [Bacteroidota bacterium]